MACTSSSKENKQLKINNAAEIHGQSKFAATSTNAAHDSKVSVAAKTKQCMQSPRWLRSISPQQLFRDVFAMQSRSWKTEFPIA
jgi:hypothetical protein